MNFKWVVLVALLFTSVAGAQEGKDFVTDDKGNKYPIGRVAPSPERLKTIHKESWLKNGHRIQTLANRAMPDSYDAEAFGLLPPVKDQGDCGSCHHFSACGVATIAHVKVGNLKNDGDGYSEQWQIDCHHELGGCNGGWEWDDCKILLNGGPLESEYGPYTARAQKCKTFKNVIAIAEMGMCSQSDGVAKTADLQACIIQYGSASVAVAADTSFASYRGGLYKGSGSRTINHAVILVGYKTVDGVVYFKLRNSWSASWGEKGYMWIRAGANQVGDSAFWVRAVAINPPAPVPPDPGPGPAPVPGDKTVVEVRITFKDGTTQTIKSAPVPTPGTMEQRLTDLEGSVSKLTNIVLKLQELIVGPPKAPQKLPEGPKKPLSWHHESGPLNVAIDDPMPNPFARLSERDELIVLQAQVTAMAKVHRINGAGEFNALTASIEEVRRERHSLERRLEAMSKP